MLGSAARLEQNAIRCNADATDTRASADTQHLGLCGAFGFFLSLGTGRNSGKRSDRLAKASHGSLFSRGFVRGASVLAQRRVPLYRFTLSCVLNSVAVVSQVAGTAPIEHRVYFLESLRVNAEKNKKSGSCERAALKGVVCLSLVPCPLQPGHVGRIVSRQPRSAVSTNKKAAPGESRLSS